MRMAVMPLNSDPCITIVTHDLASGKILLLELLTKVHSALLHVAYVHWKVAINFISMDPTCLFVYNNCPHYVTCILCCGACTRPQIPMVQ